MTLSNIRTAKIKEVIDRAIKEMADDDAVSVPENLADQVADLLSQNPACPWDAAVAEIADSVNRSRR